MSLRVWLPLNGTLDNKGLDQVTVINNGATVDNNGKIGKCYSFGASSYLKIPLPKLSEYSTTTFSMCLWAKVPSPTSGNKQLLHIGKGSGWANNRFTILYQGSTTVSRIVTSISDGSSYGAYSCYADIPIDTWIHIASVFDNRKLKLYINGELKNTYNTTYDLSFTSIEALGIGGAPNGAELLKSGYINDVRIYDHALSPLEVKQISQGLILHYPLNRGGWGQENLLKNTNVLVTNGSKTGFVLSQTIPSGTKVTFSLQIDAVDLVLSGNKRIGLEGFQNNGTNNSYKGVWITGVNAQGTYSKRIFATVTLDRDFLINNNTFGIYIQTVSSGSVTISNPKIEIGEKATPWCPNSSDALATTMGLNDNIEYDTSGFGNNGIKVGTFDYDSDTPKYNVSTVFPSGINWINAGRGAMVQDSITISCWVNYSSWGNPISCTEGGGWNFEEGNGGIRTPFYISGIGYKTAQSTITSASLKNGWHMLTSLYNRTNSIVKIFIDGELAGSLDTGTTNKIAYNGNNVIMIGAEAGGSATSPASTSFIGKISDVRIYCTALSDDDIKSLYNNSAYIDNQGNIYGAIYEEV